MHQVVFVCFEKKNAHLSTLISGKIYFKSRSIYEVESLYIDKRSSSLGRFNNSKYVRS